MPAAEVPATKWLAGQRLLLISNESWFGPLLSKHHIALELCRRGNRVVYLEPYYHVGDLRRGKLPREVQHERYHDLRPPSLTRVTPFRMPKSHLVPAMSAMTRALLAAQLAFRSGRPDAVISFAPGFSFLANRWSGTPFVYYCVDHQEDQEEEARTLARADVVVAATHELHRRFAGRCRRLCFVPHGVDPALLTSRDTPIPPELAGLGRPIVGFAGAINQRVDVELVLALAAARPSWSVVLVGPYRLGSFGFGLPDAPIERLRSLPNIHLTGPVPSERLPTFLAAFDVGMVPYDRRHPLVHFSYHKALQHLAVGRPMVTSCAADGAEVLPHVHTAPGTEDFIRALTETLEGVGPQTSPECRAAAKKHSWASRVDRLSRILAGEEG